jgi:copper homeostasis protein
VSALLEVAVLHARDVPGAQEGGADRLFVEADDLSPEPSLVQDVCRGTDLPVRVMLRLNESWTTNGGEFARLVGLAEDYLARGAEGVAFGFLDDDLEVDVRTCAALAEALPDVPWTFHRAFDAALDTRNSWRRVLGLPGLDSVQSAGSPRGLEVGYDDLLATARGDARIASLLMPAGGLLAEHVPWFVRLGVTQFHLGPQARPGASYKPISYRPMSNRAMSNRAMSNRAYVDAGHVRSFRLLIDDAVQRSI